MHHNDPMAGRTTYSHKIDLEIIENQALKKNSRSLGVFGDLLIFFLVV
jgi:hypothetical protein